MKAEGPGWFRDTHSFRHFGSLGLPGPGKQRRASPSLGNISLPLVATDTCRDGGGEIGQMWDMTDKAKTAARSPRREDHRCRSVGRSIAPHGRRVLTRSHSLVTRRHRVSRE